MALIIKAQSVLSAPGSAPTLPDLVTGLAWDFDAQDLSAGNLTGLWTSKAGSFGASMTPMISSIYPAPVVDTSGPGGKKALVFTQTDTAATGLLLNVTSTGMGLTPMSYAYLIQGGLDNGVAGRVHSAGTGQHSFRVSSGNWRLGSSSYLSIGGITGAWQSIGTAFGEAEDKGKIDNGAIVRGSAGNWTSNATQFYVGTSTSSTTTLPAIGDRFKGKLVRWKAWNRVLSDDDLNAAVVEMQKQAV